MHMNRLLTTSLLALSLAACDSGGDDSGGSGGSTGGTTSGSASASESESESASASASASGTTTSTTDESTTTGEDGSSSGSQAESSTGEAGSSSGEAGSSSGGEESSSSGGNGDALPDLDMNDADVITDTTNSIYIQTTNFTKDSCAWQDGCLAGTGQRRLLRFDTITPNLGNADFYAGNETINPELFEYSDCQGNYVLADYAQYRLLDSEGNEVASGHKAAFALIDLAPWTDDAGPGQYGFNNMGISVGWADIYGAGLQCQWVDITDVTPGDYVLELSINPEHVIEEATFDNNILLIDVTVTEDDTTPGGGTVPAEWTCTPTYYDANDGCDCGCGVVDPDCGGSTSDLCDYCLEGSCSPESCADISADDNAVCN